MRCSMCGSYNREAIDSREIDDGFRRRRRYKCRDCGARHTTYEIPAEEYEHLKRLYPLISKIKGEIQAL